jgi:hypothetical protein
VQPLTELAHLAQRPRERVPLGLGDALGGAARALEVAHGEVGAERLEARRLARDDDGGALPAPRGRQLAPAARDAADDHRVLHPALALEAH